MAALWLYDTQVHQRVSLYGFCKCPEFLKTQDIKYYEKMPIQYTAISHGGKNDNFQMKKVDNFLIFTQSIDCGFTLEPPQWGRSNEYPQSMF